MYVNDIGVNFPECQQFPFHRQRTFEGRSVKRPSIGHFGPQSAPFSLTVLQMGRYNRVRTRKSDHHEITGWQVQRLRRYSMRKVISMVVLTLVVSVSMLFANGSSEKSSSAAGSPVSLTLAYPSGDSKVDIMKEIVKSYVKEKGGAQQVNVVVVPASGASYWGSYFDKIQTMIAGGTAPDVVRVAIEGIQTFVARDLALPLDQYMKSDPQPVLNYSDLAPKLQAPFVIDGKTYGFVWDWNNVVIHINTDMLKAVGLPIPPSNWSLSDFLKYAKALTRTVNGQQVYGFAVPNYYFGMEGWLYANGAGILTDDQKRGALDTPKAEQIVQLFHDMIYKDKVSPVPTPSTDAVNLMVTGKVAMISAGRWPFGTYVPNKFTTVAVQYIPLMANPRKVVFGSGAFPVIKATPHPKEAYELSAFLSGAYSQKTGIAIDSIPTRISVMKEVLPTTPGENWQIFSESADFAAGVQAPPGYPEIASIFDRYTGAVWSNQMDVPTAMQKASAEMTQVLANQ